MGWLSTWAAGPAAIEFRCHPDDLDVIPAPVFAGKHMPDWFKRLPPKLGPGLTTSTIKRCMPFLDAMTAGWVIPLAADVEVITENGESNFRWNFHRPMIEAHNPKQIEGMTSSPPAKFMNYWSIKVPRGWSALFVPPLNRPDERFTIMSGIVDCDRYEEFINFPFVMNKPWSGIIEAGTPIAQVIPFPRSMAIRTSVVRSFTAREQDDLERLRRQRGSHESLYRDKLQVRKW